MCGVCGEFLVGKCVPGNSSVVVRGGGWFLGWLYGFWGGEVRHGNVW